MIDLDRKDLERILDALENEQIRSAEAIRRADWKSWWRDGHERQDALDEQAALDDLVERFTAAIAADQARLENPGPRVHHVRTGESLRDVLGEIDGEKTVMVTVVQ